MGRIRSRILAGITTLLFPAAAFATALDVLKLEVACEWKVTKVSQKGKDDRPFSEPYCKPEINDIWLPYVKYVKMEYGFTPDPQRMFPEHYPRKWIPEGAEVSCGHWLVTVSIPLIHGYPQGKESWSFSEPYCGPRLEEREQPYAKESRFTPDWRLILPDHCLASSLTSADHVDVEKVIKSGRTCLNPPQFSVEAPRQDELIQWIQEDASMEVVVSF